MIKKMFIAALIILTALVFAAPALAQTSYGADTGAGACSACGASDMSSCGCGVSYGAPQDCVATVSCNIPATQMIPYQTSTTEMQTVNYPVTVPQQSSVTVPKMVCVPEEVPVTTYTTACAQTQVPVQVPATAYQPCTTLIPQCKTFNLGSAPAGMGCGTGSATGSGAASSPSVGLGSGAGAGSAASSMPSMSSSSMPSMSNR